LALPTHSAGRQCWQIVGLLRLRAIQEAPHLAGAACGHSAGRNSQLAGGDSAAFGAGLVGLHQTIFRSLTHGALESRLCPPHTVFSIVERAGGFAAALWAWLLAAYGFVLRLTHKTDVKTVRVCWTILAGTSASFFLLILNIAAPPFAALQRGDSGRRQRAESAAAISGDW